jgi:hypothetical protein
MSVGLDKLQHIVALMMENRSFDHMLGLLKKEIPDIRGVMGGDYFKSHHGECRYACDRWSFVSGAICNRSWSQFY